MSSALVRRAADLPSRAEFAKRQRRFVDNRGRMYVLPAKNDPIYSRLKELGVVDEGNYERQLRKGLAFDVEKEMRELTERVMFYVQLPRVPTTGLSTSRQAFAQQRGVAPMGLNTLPALERTSCKPLLLRELESNVYYEAHVQQVQFGRRSKRGYVVVDRVRRIAR